MMAGLGIRTKLLLLFLALAVGPMAGLGIVSYLNSVGSVQDVVEQRALETVEKAAERVSAVVSPRLGEVDLLAYNQEIQDLYRGYDADDEAGLDRIGPRIERYYEQFFTGPRSAFSQVRYFDREGSLLFAYSRQTLGTLARIGYALSRADSMLSSVDLSDLPIGEELAVTTENNPPYGLVLRLGKWVRDDLTGAPMGYLLADLEVAVLMERLPQGHILGRAQALLIADARTGLLIRHPSPALIGTDLGNAVPGLSRVYASAGPAPEGSGEYKSGDETRLVAFRTVAPLHWTLGVVSRPSRFIGAVRDAGLLNLGIALASSALALVLVSLVVARITRSIRQVVEGAEAIAADDLDQEIRVETGDETSILADAFNRMAASLRGTLGELRQLASELEDRVRQRTADLEEANQTVQEQNEQLQLDTAVERVRAAALSMRSTNDLTRLVGVLFEQLLDLGMDAEWTSISFVDEAADTVRNMVGHPSYSDLHLTSRSPHAVSVGDRVSATLNATYQISDWFLADSWRAGKPETSTWNVTPEQIESLAARLELEAISDTWRDKMLGQHAMLRIPFQYGLVELAQSEQHDEYIPILQQFAEALTLGFTRYLDFQQLEAQNRNLEAERALERVRTQVAAMEGSGDLPRVVQAVEDSLAQLGVEFEDVSINLADAESGTVRLSAAPRHTPDTALLSEAYGRIQRVSWIWQEWMDHWRKRESWSRIQTPDDWEREFEEARAAGLGDDIDLLLGDELAHEYASQTRAIADAYFAQGAMGMNRLGSDLYDEEEVRLLERFAEVFGLAYRRHLDLKAAEDRASQMARQRAAEHVRAEALSMRTSDDMDRVVAALYEEMVDLGIETPAVTIMFLSDDAKAAATYDASDNPGRHGLTWDSGLTEVSERTVVSQGSWSLAGIRETGHDAAWRTGEPHTYAHQLTPELTQRHCEQHGLRGEGEGAVERLAATWEGVWQVTNVPFQYGQVGYRERESSEEHVGIVQELANALELGYLRFLDFQRLEDQNRGLEVERALERVRTQVAAMETSGDLPKVVQVVEDSLKGFGVPCQGVGINTVDRETEAIHVAHAAPLLDPPPTADEREAARSVFSDPAAPVWSEWLEHWREGKTWARPQLPDAAAEGIHRLRELGHGPLADRLLSSPAFLALSQPRYISDTFFADGALAMSRAGEEPFSEEDLRLQERFTEVFALGYTRHLDLKAAEERAQQAGLERAAERLRAEAQAMRSSDDLLKVTGALQQATMDLGLEVQWSHVFFVDEAAGAFTNYHAYQWPERPGAAWTHPHTVRISDLVVATRYPTASLANWAEREEYEKGVPWIKEWEFGEDYARSWSEGMGHSQVMPETVEIITGPHTGIFVPFEHGVVSLTMREPHDEYVAIVQELTGALSLGFTRFLDFQRLEEQNRNLEVERALERIRTEVAAMETSADLPKVVTVVRDSLVEFGVPCDAVGINIADPETGYLRAYSPGDGSEFGADVDEHSEANRAFRDISRNSSFGQDWRAHWHEQSTWARSCDAEDWGRFCDQARAAGFGDAVDCFMGDAEMRARVQLPYSIVDAYFPQGSLAMNRESTEPFGDEHVALLERFTEVFALGYTRHLDLIAAEERARQLAVENAAERLRAEAQAMRSTEDLPRLVAQLWREMGELGIETPGATFLFIDDESRDFMNMSAMGNPRRRGISWSGAGLVEIDENSIVHHPEWISWDKAVERLRKWGLERSGLSAGTTEEIIAQWRSGEPWSHQQTMPEGYRRQGDVEYSAPLDDWQGDWVVTNVPFGHGAIGYREREASDEHIQIVRQLGDSLSIGYLRYLDFQRLEEQNRQVDLSRARHRVRGEVLTMASSDDIGRVVVVLREELDRLGVATDQVGMNIVDEEAGQIRTSWASILTEGATGESQAGEEGVTQLTDEEQTPAVQQLLEHWRRREIWNRTRSEGVQAGASGWVVDVPFEYGTLAMNRGQDDSEASEFTEEEIEALVGFTDVVSLGYTRFLDFQRLEEQNRRLAVERALERIRAEVSSMESTDDMGRVVGRSFTELLALGVEVDSLNVAVADEAEGRFRQYVLIQQEAYDRGFRGTPAVSGIVEGVDLYRGDRPFYEPTDWALEVWRSEESQVSALPPDHHTRPSTIEQYRTQFGMDITEATGLHTHQMTVPFSHGVLLFHSSSPGGPSGADVATAEEFARMLSLGYARFLDFQAAEERARELTIGRAVERVRAEATAMRRSADIGKVMAAMYEGWRDCGLAFTAGCINIVDAETSRLHTYLLYPAEMVDGGTFESRLVARDVVPGINLYRSLDHDVEFYRHRGWALPGSGAALWTAPETFPDDLEIQWGERQSNWDQLVGLSGINVPFASFGGVFAMAQSGVQFTEDDVALVERFADAVSLGYTRFLDLQAAEQQAAQEAREAATERVRAAAMSMRTTEDMRDVVTVLLREMVALGVNTPGCNIVFLDEEVGRVLEFMAMENPRLTGGTWTSPLLTEYDDNTCVFAMDTALDQYLEGGPITYSFTMGAEPGQILKTWQEKGIWSAEFTEEMTQAFVESLGISGEAHWTTGHWTGTAVAFRYGKVGYREPEYSEEHAIVVRELTEALELGYLRFLDFQRLEQRNRELAVAGAVEHVRAEATAMRESADVRNVMVGLWEGLVEAGLKPGGAVVQTVDEESNTLGLYGAIPSQTLTALGDPIPDDKIAVRDALPGVHLVSASADLSWARELGYAMPGIESSITLTSPEHHLHLQRIFEGGPWPEEMAGTPGLNVPFSHGGLFVQLAPTVELTEEHLRLVERFADAVSLGYRRYMDLVAAEERARQQARDAAAERVRAAAMEMQSPDDIRQVLGVLAHELADLDIEVPSCQIDFIDPRTDEVINYQTNLNPRRYGLSWTAPEVVEYDEQYITFTQRVVRGYAEDIRSLRQEGGTSTYQQTLTAQWLTDFVSEKWGMSAEAFATSDLMALWEGEWNTTLIPFGHGLVRYFHRIEGDDHIAVVQELAQALSLGFVRFLDFQRLEEQNRALELANDEIQQANRLKSEFLANMSHELRTPMNAIVGFSKLVYRKARGVLDDRQVGNLEKVLQSSEILLALINDILDLSKIEAGRLEIQPEDFDIRELIEGCISTVSPMVKGGVTVQASLSDQVGMVYSDPSRIRQIIINLLSNATKFTESGTITVGLKPVGEELLELSVADTGIGIPQEALQAIFEEFRQVDGTTTRKYGGTGLGLSISQRLAGMLGGGIRVESEEGCGTTFTVSITARYGQATEARDRRSDTTGEQAVAADGAPADGRRIVLSIDDDPNVISLLTQELEEEGYQVVGATRALEGIEKARSVGPHAITLDIMMPGMDGWEAISRLKADPATRDIPLIVVSIIDNKELGYRLGADEYLVKPVEKDALLRSLKRFDRGGGEALVIDDDPAVVELVTQLLEEDGWTVRGAGDGQQGLNKLRRRTPDVVLLDLMMPVMDGFETLARIRASRNERIRDLPVIVVTAKDLSARERRDLLQSTSRIVEKDGLNREHLLRELRASLKDMNETRGD